MGLKRKQERELIGVLSYQRTNVARTRIRVRVRPGAIERWRTGVHKRTDACACGHCGRAGLVRATSGVIFGRPRIATGVEGPEGRDTFHVGYSGTHGGLRSRTAVREMM